MELHWSEVRWKDPDAGFSLYTAPPFCHCPGISKFRHRFGIGSKAKAKVWGEMGGTVQDTRSKSQSEDMS